MQVERQKLLEGQQQQWKQTVIDTQREFRDRLDNLEQGIKELKQQTIVEVSSSEDEVIQIRLLKISISFSVL